jgi:transcriptional regulator with XRE-family HTH domain
MNITGNLADDVILAELGHRIAQFRLARNMTQAEVAAEAGLSISTLARLESGAVATQLSGFVRVCRVLGLVEQLEQLIPQPGPMDELRAEKQPGGLRRERARARPHTTRTDESKAWTWGDD